MIPEKDWIAAYTRARSERALARFLQEQGIDSFVPLQPRLRRWSDRKKWVEMPLIPSYVFVRVSSKEHYYLYDSPGFVKVVMFHGHVAIVRPEEIEFLRKAVLQPEAVVVSKSRFTQGEKVRIVSGLFAGYEGAVIRGEGGCRVAVGIEQLDLAVVVTVNADDVRTDNS